MKKILSFAAFVALVAAAVFAGEQATSPDWPPPVCPPSCSN